MPTWLALLSGSRSKEWEKAKLLRVSGICSRSRIPKVRLIGRVCSNIEVGRSRLSFLIGGLSGASSLKPLAHKAANWFPRHMPKSTGMCSLLFPYLVIIYFPK